MHPAAVAGRSEQLATTYIIILCQDLMATIGIMRTVAAFLAVELFLYS